MSRRVGGRGGCCATLGVIPGETASSADLGWWNNCARNYVLFFFCFFFCFRDRERKKKKKSQNRIALLQPSNAVAKKKTRQVSLFFKKVGGNINKLRGPAMAHLQSLQDSQPKFKSDAWGQGKWWHLLPTRILKNWRSKVVVDFLYWSKSATSRSDQPEIILIPIGRLISDNPGTPTIAWTAVHRLNVGG